MTAPDIFLSYNREDAERAKQFAEGFAAQGLDVWWDVALRSGEAYDEVTEEALHDARAVVVLWSPRSVVSRWVRSEATIADRNKTLVPVMIEPCRRPVMFELTQTAELSHWTGDAGDSAWQGFVKDVRRFIGKGPAAAAAPAPSPAAPVKLATPGKVSVVVLPFTNMGGDPEQEYFADGISEDIITDLSKVSALAVISRNTAFTFKGKSHDVRRVAGELGVSHVLEGSVRKAGNRVRITAQLIEGKSDEHVWAERFDRDLTDIFELQDEISKAIVAALKIRLLPQEREAIEDRATTNLEAYDLYMRARSAANAARAAEDMTGAAQLYRQALEADPGFSPALSALSQLYYQLVLFDPRRLSETKGKLDRLCDDAMRHAPDDWGTQVLLATQAMMEMRWADALDAFEQAMAAAPSFDTNIAPNFATCLANVGRFEDSIRVLEAARAIDPLGSYISVVLQMAYFGAGQSDASRLEYERTNSLTGNREEAEHTALFRVWAEGDKATIEAQFRRFLDVQSIVTPYMADYLQLIDQPGAVSAILHEAFEDPANQDASRVGLLACHAAMNGEPKLAVAAMRRATEFGFPAFFLFWMPHSRQAHQTAEFKDLIRDLGIYDYWRKSGNWGDFARPVGDDDFEIVA